MPVRTVHRVSGLALVTLALISLLSVVSGYFQAPQLDEGSAAHIFQLSIASLVPTTLLFIATADRRQRFPVKTLAFAATLAAMALAALYYLERFYNR